MNHTSLLAHLFPYFKGSQEDVATCSLNYIVSSDEKIGRAFENHIENVLHLSIEEQLQFKCQAVGDNLERPDMAGYNANGDERILCESKFYAALTPNQPNEYLKRLVKNKGQGLMFICPQLRIMGLWDEILEVLKQELRYTEIDKYCVEIDNSVKLGITTWGDVLDRLALTASAEAPNMLSDIVQLQGYCKQLDSDAFIPYKEEELSVEVATKADRPYRLLDELVKSLQADKNHKVSLEHLRATPVWGGYTRYLYLDEFAVTLTYDVAKWKNIGSKTTPFWICIKKFIDGHWVMDESCKKGLLKVDANLKDGDFIALIPRCHVALSEVVDDMKKQINDILYNYKE